MILATKQLSGKREALHAQRGADHRQGRHHHTAANTSQRKPEPDHGGTGTRPPDPPIKTAPPTDRTRITRRKTPEREDHVYRRRQDQGWRPCR